jgi:hypothetical protein
VLSRRFAHRRVTSAGDGQHVLLPDDRADRLGGRVRHQPAGRKLAADQPNRDARGRWIVQGCEAAVPVSVLGQDCADGRLVELRQCGRLREHVARGPGGIGARHRSERFVEIVIVALHRVVEHRGNRGQRHRRRVEEDEHRRPDAGRGQLSHGHPAPAVADDREIPAVEPGRADEGRDRSCVVAERDLPGPVARPSVGHLVWRDDVPVETRAKRRPDPPEGVRRRGDAVDEQERRPCRFAPRSGHERDPVRLHAKLARVWRRVEDGADRGVQIGGTCIDR